MEQIQVDCISYFPALNPPPMFFNVLCAANIQCMAEIFLS